MSKRFREWRLARARAARAEKPAAPPDPVEQFTKKAHDLDAVRKSVEDAAAVSAGFWLSYLFVLFYIGIAAGAVTHRDLLLENPVKLPFLSVDLPLVAFFFLAPILFIVSHAYTLVHFVMLAAKVGVFDAELRAQLGEAPETREGLRRQLPSNIFVQFLAGPGDIRKGGLGWLLKAVAWISLVIGPVLLLLLIQAQFLPYHLEWVTWVQRVAIAVDVILLWLFWPAVLNGRSKLMWHLERRSKGWQGVLALTDRYIAGLIACLIPIGLAFTAATFPGEGLDEWIGKRQWVPPYPSAKWSDQKDWMSFLTTWYGQEGWTSFHDVLFNGDVDDVTRRRKSLFSNTLVLPAFDALEAAKIDDPKKLDTIKHTLILRGRHLESAVFYSADLRKADLEGAHLQGAQLKGASLQAARLQGASLLLAQLQGASLQAAQLQGASLQDAQLQGASLQAAQLQGASLQAAQLKGASLQAAQLQGAMLDRADLHGASLKDARLLMASLQGAQLEGARLQNANLDRARLQNASLFQAQLQGASLQDAQLQGASLFYAHLQGANLEAAQLKGANLEDADLKGANLEDADLQGASSSDAHLQGANLERAWLQGASLYGAHLQGASLDHAHLQGASLSANLQGASLDYAQLQGASLDYAELQGASLKGAELQGADFRNSTLAGTDMSGARVWRTSFEHASLTAVFIDGVKESALSKKTFATLQAKIMHVPEGGIREFALKRIEILNPDIFGPEASERETLEKGHVDKAAYRESLAGQLKSLACSGDEDAVHIVRGLIANGRIWETGAQAPGLVDAILKPDCPVSAALTEADKAALRKLSAGEMQELVCKGKNNALNILRGFLNDGHIKETGDLAPSLVEAILSPDCPVSAVLTEADKAALKSIAKEASAAH